MNLPFFLGSLVWLQIFLLHIALSFSSPALSPCSTFQVSLLCIFPSFFWLSSIPYPWNIRPHHFPQYVFVFSLYHIPAPVQSSLRDLFGSLRHSCCSSDVPVVPDLVFACLHIHSSILISFISIRFSCHVVVSHVSAPYSIAGLITGL